MRAQKGSELCPRTHYFIADAFRKAGFPPGVVNFVLHRPQDAAEMFETMISHPEVRKCSFTGSTQVGRQIAIKAASFLKPVLMELGGKNFAIVLDDANLDKAADAIIDGALLNVRPFPFPETALRHLRFHLLPAYAARRTWVKG